MWNQRIEDYPAPSFRYTIAFLFIVGIGICVTNFKHEIVNKVVDVSGVAITQCQK